MKEKDILQKIETSALLVVYFSYPECSVCKTLRPKVEKLVADFPRAEFLYVDTHLNPEVSGQHLVFTVPTIALFSGGKEMKRLSRHFSMGELESALERFSEFVESV